MHNIIRCQRFSSNNNTSNKKTKKTNQKQNSAWEKTCI